MIAAGMLAEVYAERVSSAVTPALRLRFRTGRRLSPRLSFGAGAAWLRRKGDLLALGQWTASQTGSNLTPALVPAAGLDVNLRGRWNDNPLAGVSLGYRTIHP